MRSLKNNLEITEKAYHAKNIVIVGASFIGMELAATLREKYKNCNITVIDNNSCPFEKVLGVKIGESLKKYVYN